MLGKLKSWLLGSVILKKVIGKIAKHGAGAIAGFIFGPKLAPILGPVLEQLNITEASLEVSLVVIITALFGGAWNYIEHRFFKK